MGMFGKQSGMNYIGSRLSAEQVNTISYAYIDICAANKLMDEEENWGNRIQAEAELYEATNQTKRDLENEFPFLLEDVEDE